MLGAQPKFVPVSPVKMGGGYIQSSVFNKHIQVFETHKWQVILSFLLAALANAYTHTHALSPLAYLIPYPNRS